MKIITSDNFKKVPWKNGKGETIELAINQGGTIDDFLWRISMAKVIENGAFSDFSGYQRSLILVDGNGLELEHDGGNKNYLRRTLDIANFDGNSKTIATLISGPITDFNLMVRKGKYDVKVSTFYDCQSVALQPSVHTFIYSLSSPVRLQVTPYNKVGVIPTDCLLQASGNCFASLFLEGENFIVIQLQEK